jgi:hypothetical protein
MFHRVCAPLIVSLTNPHYPTYRPALKVPRLKRRGLHVINPERESGCRGVWYTPGGGGVVVCVSQREAKCLGRLENDIGCQRRSPCQKVCAACANFPEVEAPRTRILLAPRRKDAKFGRNNNRPQTNSIPLIRPLRLGVFAGDIPAFGCDYSALGSLWLNYVLTPPLGAG